MSTPQDSRTALDPLRVAFDRHYGALLRMGTLIAGSQDVAKDLAQDALLAVAAGPRATGGGGGAGYLRRAVLWVGINWNKNHTDQTNRQLRRETSSRSRIAPMAPHPSGSETSTGR